MIPFPNVRIPDGELPRQAKAFQEVVVGLPGPLPDGAEPWDWRESATFSEALRLGYIASPNDDGVQEWYDFRHWRTLVTGDPEMDAAQPIPDYDYVLREGWKEFRQWSLTWLGRPAVPAPERLPRYSARSFAAWQAAGDPDAPLPTGWEDDT